MLAKERQNKIISMLEDQKIVKISEIVRIFEVSNETARRDLESIQDLGIAKRVYGGAILQEQSDRKFNLRHSRYSGPAHGREERDAIGKMAATLIHDGESVLLDTGTTVHEISKGIKNMRNVTVVTNSIHVLMELVDTDVTVYILGGKVSHDERTIIGSVTTDSLDNFYVDKVFLGAGGVTFEGGISDYNMEEAFLKARYAQHANKVYLVANSSKFGVNALGTAMPLSAIDVIITDTNLTQEYVKGIQDMGIELILVDPADFIQES